MSNKNIFNIKFGGQCSYSKSHLANGCIFTVFQYFIVQLCYYITSILHFSVVTDRKENFSFDYF